MTRDLHPVELAALAAIALIWALATVARWLLTPVLALLLAAAGWRPAQAAPDAPEGSPEPAVALPAAPSLPAAPEAPVSLPLASLTVAELRRRARVAGHRSLAHRGRRAELLAALA